MDEKIADLFKHTAILKAGIERWETLLNRKRVHVTRMRERAEQLLESEGGETDRPAQPIEATSARSEER